MLNAPTRRQWCQLVRHQADYMKHLWVSYRAPLDESSDAMNGSMMS